jgi:hypothetical protein
VKEVRVVQHQVQQPAETQRNENASPISPNVVISPASWAPINPPKEERRASATQDRREDGAAWQKQLALLLRKGFGGGNRVLKNTSTINTPKNEVDKLVENVSPLAPR